jgi:hypothetical protein
MKPTASSSANVLPSTPLASRPISAVLTADPLSLDWAQLPDLPTVGSRQNLRLILAIAHFTPRMWANAFAFEFVDFAKNTESTNQHRA